MEDKSLKAAVQRLLRPLVRMLIRHGVSHSEFAAMARQVYVKSACEDFVIPGRKQTISRIAMLTGVQRKQVRRLQDLVDDDPAGERYNRALRVISGWRHDPAFADSRGAPADLPVLGPDGSFEALARRTAGDLPYRAVLDELVRAGNVEIRDERAHLLRERIGPAADVEAKLAIMGHAVRDLLETVDHNIHADGTSRLQLTTAYDNLTPESVQQFRQLSASEGRELLAAMDAWLAARDRDAQPGDDAETPAESGTRMRAGLGVYYFEEKVQG